LLHGNNGTSGNIAEETDNNDEDDSSAESKDEDYEILADAVADKNVVRIKVDELNYVTHVEFSLVGF
jgi:hypothetical protein